MEANVPLVSSLATLAYDARRSKFFRKQLLDTLQMVNKGYIGADSLFGSWAGAMGQPQFMPSSYLAFAQDFDGDGRRDIWKNEGDVFASIANYLAKHGWNDNLNVGPPGNRASVLNRIARQAFAPGNLDAAPEHPAPRHCRNGKHWEFDEPTERFTNQKSLRSAGPAGRTGRRGLYRLSELRSDHGLQLRASLCGDCWHACRQHGRAK